MSTSSKPNINAAPATPTANEHAAEPRKKDAPSPALEDTLHDLAILRASGVDLAAVLASTTASAVPVSTTTATAIIGETWKQVERVNDAREKLEDVAAGLQDG
ncbi:hypothetical protein EDB86DRAFT_3076471 [Lactarius hatsudake]|nr:hypothetical protein EDB86DRAFT_3076471 [Lactarius hatsudake]